MFIDDRIEQIAFQLQEELENVKEQFKAVQDENTKLKATIDLHCKADAEKTEKIKRLSEELDSLKYTNLILRTNAATCRLNLDKDCNEDKIKELEVKIETLENDRSEDVETINKLNIRVRDLNSTISTLIERVSKSDEENQELKKRVQQLKYIIEDLNKKLYE